MPQTYADDHELFQIVRGELFTAVVGDVMDSLGFLHQFLPPDIQPVRDGMLLVGRAMPVVEADYLDCDGAGHLTACDPSPASATRYHGIRDAPGPGPLSGKPFGLMLEALDDLKPGEIYVASGSAKPYALWGELMSTRARYLGANGALLNGYARDIVGICALGFPTFAAGRYAQDQGPRGKVVDYRVPVEIGGVRIEPGALLFGDSEGVLVVPREAECEVIERALEKARGEKLVATAIREGMSAVQAFSRYGIM